MAVIEAREPDVRIEPDGRRPLAPSEVPSESQAAARKVPDEMPQWLWLLPGAGLVAIVLYAFVDGFFTASSLRVLAVAGLSGGAALMVGALLGFLFGIPRTLQGERPPDVLEPAGNGRPEYRVNTNLEQISDWLTKILVGVGLVQLGSIIDSVGGLANHVGAALGEAAAGPAFALAVLVYFFVGGFLLAYLWTRLNLTGAFARAEAAAMRSYVDDRLEGMAKDVDERIVGVENEVEEQRRRDVEALSLVERQLDPQAPTVNATELDATVAAASPAVKIQVFLRAREQRAGSWRQDLVRMERTIPVFEALIASDSEHRFHRHFAQLAFALKDSRQPDYEKAISLLTEAIHIRGSAGFSSYEFNRAHCRIRLDAQTGDDPARQPLIIADLRAAATSSFWLGNIATPDGEFMVWLARQGITLDALRQP